MKSSISAACLSLILASGCGAIPDEPQAGFNALGKAQGRFEGQEFDLSQEHPEIKACVITESGVDCFRSEQEADEHAAQIDAERSQSLPTPTEHHATCRTWVYLYTRTSCDGTRYQFRDAWHCQNLNRHGISAVRSTRTNACNVCGHHEENSCAGTGWCRGASNSCQNFGGAVSSIFIH